MDQLFLPMDLEELIPPGHVVRVVNEAVNRISDDVFLKYYPGGGRSSFHPKMLTKVLVYAYTQKIYSSRQIAKALRENIPFMWLAARQTPDFRTINRFRSQRMKGLIDDVFAAVLQLLIEEGYVTMEHYFLDGNENRGQRQSLYLCMEKVHRPVSGKAADPDSSTFDRD